MTSPLTKEVLNVLACPNDKGEVKYNTTRTALICVKCKAEYPIKDGIPVMLAQ